MRANWRRRGRLTDDEARQVEAWLLEGKPSTEIAQLMGISHPAVLKRKGRLEAKLGEKLGRQNREVMSDALFEEKLSQARDPVEWCRELANNPKVAWDTRLRAIQVVYRAERDERADEWTPPEDQSVWLEALKWALLVQKHDVRDKLVQSVAESLIEPAGEDEGAPDTSATPDPH